MPGQKPLLLKQRDGGEVNSRYTVLQGEKYRMYALVARSDFSNKNVLCGMNNTGFCIVNSATFNLGKRSEGTINPGRVMYEALSVCATIEEFENLLTQMQQSEKVVPAIFGVIDTNSGAAYYEVGYRTWIKYDVNDSNVAPKGYLIRTNFAVSGDPKGEKRGYVRYLTATNIMDKVIVKKVPVTPKWIMDNVCRSFRNDLVGIDLQDGRYTPNGISFCQDFICNQWSSSATIFQGKTGNSNNDRVIMWTVLGNPSTSVMVPLLYGVPIPHFLEGTKATPDAALCRLSISLRDKIYLNQYDKDKWYIKYNVLFNSRKNGLTQRIFSLEEAMLERLDNILKRNNESHGLTNDISDIYHAYWIKIENLLTSL